MKTALKTAPTKYPISLKEAKGQLNIELDWTENDDHINTLIATATRKVEQDLHRRLITQTWYKYLDEWPDIITLPFGQLQSISSIKYKDEDGAQSTFGTALTITGITKANPGVVSSTAQGLSVYDRIHFSDLTEMTELNGTTQTITAVGGVNDFSINDTSGYVAAETTGGDCGTSIDYIEVIESEPGQIILGHDKVWPADVLYPSNPIEIEFVCGYGDNGSDVDPDIKHAIKIFLSGLYENREPEYLGLSISKLNTYRNLLEHNVFYGT